MYVSNVSKNVSITRYRSQISFTTYVSEQFLALKYKDSLNRKDNHYYKRSNPFRLSATSLGNKLFIMFLIYCCLLQGLSFFFYLVFHYHFLLYSCFGPLCLENESKGQEDAGEARRLCIASELSVQSMISFSHRNWLKQVKLTFRKMYEK